MTDFTPVNVGVTYNTPNGIWGFIDDSFVELFDQPYFCDHIINMYKSFPVKGFANVPEGATLREIGLFGYFSPDRRIYWYEDDK